MSIVINFCACGTGDSELMVLDIDGENRSAGKYSDAYKKDIK